MEKIKISYSDAINKCITEFKEKNAKYGQSWIEKSIFTLAQQIFIKINRVLTIQRIGQQKVDDPIENEFPGIFNYCMLAKIKVLWKKEGKPFDYRPAGEEVFTHFENVVNSVKELYKKKNHDYGEIWRELYVSSMTQFMMDKYRRLEAIYLDKSKKEEEKLDDYDEIFKDIANYSIFSKIRIDEGLDPMI